MKGILLAGGLGTRLYPMTQVISKQLLPVFEKPMIYYPLSTLIHAGATEVLVITSPTDSSFYRKLLNDGQQFGIRISYEIQEEPRGIAQSVIIAKEFLASQDFWLILGDNLFHGPDFGKSLRSSVIPQGCLAFAYHVQNPSSFGVVTFDKNLEQILKLEEKPNDGNSNWAIPGLYFFDSSAEERVLTLKPSARNELEILDLLNHYFHDGQLKIRRVSRGNAWFDLGTAKSILSASVFVQAIQESQGLLIGSPEEAAFNNGRISLDALKKQISLSKESTYINNLLASFSELE